MPTETASDVINYQIGLAQHGDERGIAIRFSLANGRMAQFVLSPDLATGLATTIQMQLKMLSDMGLGQRH